MRPIRQHRDEQDAVWQYVKQFPDLSYRFDKNTVRGSQFQTPLLEFSGACDGCGETAVCLSVSFPSFPFSFVFFSDTPNLIASTVLLVG